MVRKPDPYGLKGIYIERFRNMRDVNVPLGQRITVIAGQNGTGKSTILGMLGQPFGMTEARTLFGKSCRTKFTDVFNMSPDHDEPGEHLYYLDFRDESISDGKQHVQVKSYPRTNAKSHIRFVTGATRGAGDGNIDYPVVYLGLRRTYPVGEVANPESMDAGLGEDEVREFCEWYSRIIVPTSGASMDPVRMSKSNQKDTLLVNTGTYDFLANSAGQDNLGQILGAVISFQRIKTGMGEAYRGGLLLIDEFDATLFPASQTGLLDILYDVAPTLNLQVVFTTHSTNLIEHALGMAKRGDDVSVTYLRARTSGVNAEQNPPMDAIESDLLIRPLPAKQGLKTEIWCEDAETKWFLLQMMPSRLKKKCDIRDIGLGCGQLGELAVRDAPALKNVVFVVDADSDKDVRKAIKECTRRFVLPGDEESPEQSVFSMLQGFDDDDAFWDTCARGYTKQMFIRNWQSFKREWESDGARKKRRLEKAWFRNEKASGVWKANGSAVYAAWSAQHRDDVEGFVAGLEHRVDAIINRMEYERSSQ